MSDQLKYATADLTKISPQADGSVLVYGRLGGETVDLDNQILDKKWLDTAVPKWMERANIRSMHQKIAAGKAQSATDNQPLSQWDIVAKIVDPIEAMKCREGVYTGFSVGIKGGVVKADKMAEGGRIVGGTIIECSLVDYPCDPNNKLAISEKGAEGDQPIVAPSEEEVTADESNQGVTVPEPAVRTKIDDDDADDTKDEKVAKPAKKPVAKVDGDSADKADEATANDADDDKKKSADASPAMLFVRDLLSHGGSPTEDQVKAAFQSNPEIAKLAGVVVVEDVQKSADVLTKVATDDILEKLAEVTKAVQPDTMKAAFQAVIHDEVKPLAEKVAELEKRAAPGGPVLGGRRQVVSEEHKFASAQVALLRRYAEHPNASIAAGAQEELLKMGVADSAFTVEE